MCHSPDHQLVRPARLVSWRCWASSSRPTSRLRPVVLAVTSPEVAVRLDNPWGYTAAFVLMGPIYVRFAILMHESAHKLLFSNKRMNDWVGTWLIAYPAWTPIGLYRRAHFAHHREEFGPDEPDMA